MADTILYVAALAFIALGVPMAFVPLLPALPYMFVAAFVYGIVGAFERLTGGELWILFAIAAISVAVDQLSGALGAKLGGAHIRSLLWGIAGSIVGTFMAPILGSIAGLFLGVLFGEIYYRKSHVTAFKAAGGALLGTMAGVVANIALAIAFVVCFAFFALR